MQRPINASIPPLLLPVLLPVPFIQSSCLPAISISQDAFFYSLVYDPQQKTLLADKGEIRVGNKYQADITDLLTEGTSYFNLGHFNCHIFPEITYYQSSILTFSCRVLYTLLFILCFFPVCSFSALIGAVWAINVFVFISQKHFIDFKSKSSYRQVITCYIFCSFV